MTDTLRIEFHCHTIYSKDSLTKPADLIKVCHQRNIDRIVITDHNAIQGALEAKEIDPQMVIVGEEIMTTKGELLAAFVSKEVPKGLTPSAAIDALRSQGAFISVSHPFDRLRGGSWQLNDLMEIVPYVDAIEVFNARCFPRVYNQEATKFAQRYELLGTVGSDAHLLSEVGKAALVTPLFDDANSLKTALAEAQLDTTYSSPLVRLGSRYAVLIKKLNLQ